MSSYHQNQSQSQSQSSSESHSTLDPNQLANEEALFNLLSNWNSAEQGLFNWAQKAYNGLTTLTDPIISSQIQTGQMMSGAGQDMINRYQNVFQPEENQLVGMANSYNSAARQQQEMGAASARAQMANQAARNQSLSQLESLGVDPSSGRYAALDQAANLQSAAISTGAANQARENVQAVGRGLLGQAVQVGQAYPNAAANFVNTGVQAQNAAGSLASNRTALGSELMQAPIKTTAGLMGATKFAPLGRESQSQSTSSSSSSGFGVGVSMPQVPKPLFPDNGGGGGGYGTGTNPDAGDSGGSNPTAGQTGGSNYGGGSYAFGGPVIPRLDRRQGGTVPTNASPSGGTHTDDVPAQLTAKEFVIPRDVAMHMGTKYFEDLIRKSRRLRGAPERPIGPTFKRVR